MYKMNFNLDLLENINRYLFPLFYYSNEDSREYEIYFPSTLKSVYFDLNFILFHDHLTKKELYRRNLEKNNKYSFTQKFSYIGTFKDLKRCNPFKISKKYLKFLNNKTRL